MCQTLPVVVVELGVSNNAKLFQELTHVRRRLVISCVQGRVETMASRVIISNQMIKCLQQPGLGSAMAELYSFEGAEICFREWPGRHSITA